jgi:hypothetical protein
MPDVAGIGDQEAMARADFEMNDITVAGGAIQENAGRIPSDGREYPHERKPAGAGRKGAWSYRGCLHDPK